MSTIGIVARRRRSNCHARRQGDSRAGGGEVIADRMSFCVSLCWPLVLLAGWTGLLSVGCIYNNNNKICCSLLLLLLCRALNATRFAYSAFLTTTTDVGIPSETYISVSVFI